jgi:hypothetical protein
LHRMIRAAPPTSLQCKHRELSAMFVRRERGKERANKSGRVQRQPKADRKQTPPTRMREVTGRAWRQASQLPPPPSFTLCGLHSLAWSLKSRSPSLKLTCLRAESKFTCILPQKTISDEAIIIRCKLRRRGPELSTATDGCPARGRSCNAMRCAAELHQPRCFDTLLALRSADPERSSRMTPPKCQCELQSVIR